MSLINILKNKELRKIFGKRELSIIEKQLLGVRLKQSERTRLSRDIRKKLEVIRELSKYSLEFKLKKGAEIKRIIDEAIDIIKENRYFRDIRRIWLFGSVIDDKLTLTSDIDIAVEFASISKKEATKFRAEIAGRINDKVDIQVYNMLPEKIRKEVLSKGKIFYEQKNK